MANGGTDDIGMAHHHHGAFRHRSSHFIEMVSDSALHLDYSLSPRRTALTARFVPAPPIIAVFQAFKGPSRPFAEINFIQRGDDFRIAAATLGNIHGCFMRSPPRAALQDGFVLCQSRTKQFRLAPADCIEGNIQRSEEHTSELQSLMRISYAVFCLKKKKNKN